MMQYLREMQMSDLRIPIFSLVGHFLNTSSVLVYNLFNFQQLLNSPNILILLKIP